MSQAVVQPQGGSPQVQPRLAGFASPTRERLIEPNKSGVSGYSSPNKERSIKNAKPGERLSYLLSPRSSNSDLKDLLKKKLLEDSDQLRTLTQPWPSHLFKLVIEDAKFDGNTNGNVLMFMVKQSEKDQGYHTLIDDFVAKHQDDTLPQQNDLILISSYAIIKKHDDLIRFLTRHVAHHFMKIKPEIIMTLPAMFTQLALISEVQSSRRKIEELQLMVQHLQRRDAELALAGGSKINSQTNSPESRDKDKAGSTIRAAQGAHRSNYSTALISASNSAASAHDSESKIIAQNTKDNMTVGSESKITHQNTRENIKQPVTSQPPIHFAKTTSNNAIVEKRTINTSSLRGKNKVAVGEAIPSTTTVRKRENSTYNVLDAPSPVKEPSERAIAQSQQNPVRKHSSPATIAGVDKPSSSNIVVSNNPPAFADKKSASTTALLDKNSPNTIHKNSTLPEISKDHQHTSPTQARKNPSNEGIEKRRVTQDELIAAVMSGDVDHVKRLVADGASLRERDRNTTHPLVAAAYSGNKEMIHLVESGLGDDTRTYWKEVDPSEVEKKISQILPRVRPDKVTFEWLAKWYIEYAGLFWEKTYNEAILVQGLKQHGSDLPAATWHQEFDTFAKRGAAINTWLSPKPGSQISDNLYVSGNPAKIHTWSGLVSDIKRWEAKPGATGNGNGLCYFNMRAPSNGKIHWYFDHDETVKGIIDQLIAHKAYVGSKISDSKSSNIRSPRVGK